jgi:hypothetical protein
MVKHIVVVKRPGRIANLSPPASVEFQMCGSIHSLPLTSSWHSAYLAKHILGLKRRGPKADISSPATLEVQNMWVNTFSSPYIFMA